MGGPGRIIRHRLQLLLGDEVAGNTWPLTSRVSVSIRQDGAQLQHITIAEQGQCHGRASRHRYRITVDNTGSWLFITDGHCPVQKLDIVRTPGLFLSGWVTSVKGRTWPSLKRAHPSPGGIYLALFWVPAHLTVFLSRRGGTVRGFAALLKNVTWKRV